MDMSWQKSMNSNEDSAREQRVSKLLSVEISTQNFGRLKIVIRNLSPHGIGARVDAALLPCERVTVHLPNGRDVEATVRWVRKGTLGLALDERIEPDAYVIKNSATGPLVARDAEIGFQRLRHASTPVSRSGFQRSHRDEVLRTSDWNRD